MIKIATQGGFKTERIKFWFLKLKLELFYFLFYERRQRPNAVFKAVSKKEKKGKEGTYTTFKKSCNNQVAHPSIAEMQA